MRTFRGHTGFVEAVAFSPDGRLLGSASADSTARVWDAVSGRELHRFPFDGQSVGAVAFAPDSAALAVGTYEGNVMTFSLETGRWISHFRQQGRVTGVAYLPAGSFLVWSSYSGWKAAPLLGRYRAREWPAENGLLYTMQISPDGRHVATAGTGTHICLSPIDAGTALYLAQRYEEAVYGLAFSPDGRTLAAATADRVQLWRIPECRLLDGWSEHEDAVTCVAISGDGRRLLTGSWDRTARLYEFGPSGRGRLVGCYDWGVGSLFDVALSPDGSLAAAAGDDGDFLVVWDVE